LQVVGIFHDAGVGVAGAGAAHAYIGDVRHSQAGVLHGLLGHASHVHHDFFRRAGNAGFAFGGGDDAELVVHDARHDIGAAEVDADSVHGCSSDFIRLCRSRRASVKGTPV